MKISTKGRYAVRIMLDITQNQSDPVSIKDISDRQFISLKYTEQIINKLVKANLVQSFRGKDGGYKLTKPASEISIYEILKVTENSMSLVNCLENGNECMYKEQCKTIKCWDKLNTMIYNYLSSVTLESLL